MLEFQDRQGKLSESGFTGLAGFSVFFALIKIKPNAYQTFGGVIQSLNKVKLNAGISGSTGEIV
jgi:hypothetical protein